METIAPNKPRAGLFSVARFVDPNDPSIDWTPAGGWAHRVNCPTGGTWCCDDTGATDPSTGLPLEMCAPTDPQGFRWLPFLVYQTAGCDAGTSRTLKSLQDARDNVRTWVDINTEGWVSQAVEDGVCGNPGLDDFCTDVTGAGASSIQAGIATLLRNRAQQFIFDRPVLHIPSWFAPILPDLPWLSQMADIAFGPGYGTGATVAPAGEAWIYVTGPVEYSIAPMEELAPATLEEWRRNFDVEIYERICIYRIDPCASYRIRVNSF